MTAKIESPTGVDTLTGYSNNSNFMLVLLAIIGVIYENVEPGSINAESCHPMSASNHF